MAEPADVLKGLETIRAETLRRLEGLSQQQLDWRPPLEDDGERGWSLGEVFMHLAIDEVYLRDLIARPLLQGIDPPEDLSFYPPPPPHGLSKQVIGFWFERVRADTRHFIANWPEDASLRLKHAGGLSPMNGVEWLAGYGGHEAYHHQQIDALIALVSE